MKKIITLIMLMILTLSASAQTLDKNYFHITANRANTKVKLVNSNNAVLNDMMILMPGTYDDWTAWDGSEIVLKTRTQRVYFKRTKKEALSSSFNDFWNFNISDEVNLLGDITTLISPDGGITDLSSVGTHCFYKLFFGCPIVHAGDLLLPSTTLSDYCYHRMFQLCANLTFAPKLPATTVKPYCYSHMFQGCKSLTVAPELPATTLKPYCYCQMFMSCNSLTVAPELPATTLQDYCYDSMFNECKLLTAAPQLPATTLANNCYTGMFGGCQSLTTAPKLPAKELKEACYKSMFVGCTALTVAPELPATTLANDCYESMFYNCSALTTPPSVLPAVTGGYRCYSQMFYNCKTLEYTPVIKLNTASQECFSYMFSHCSALSVNTDDGKRIMNVTTDAKDWGYHTFDMIKGNVNGLIVSANTTYYAKDCASATLNNYGFCVYSSFTDVRIKTPGVKVYTGKLEGETLTLSEIDTDVIPAGTGVFLSGGREMSGQIVEFENLNTKSSPLTYNDLVATTSSQGDLLEREAGKLYYNLNLNNVFMGSEFVIRHNMAVLTTTSPVNRKNNISIKFAENDYATGINNISTTTKAQAKYMNNGRIVILQNGKKYNTAGQIIE